LFDVDPSHQQIIDKEGCVIMKPKLNQRKEADKTRSSILKAATKLFAKKGFAGTPTALIAETAKVNEALIFHHFGNKAELWKKVKADITERSKVGPINPTPSSLQAFLREAIAQRLNLYDNNPALHRIKQWQNLEDHAGKLITANRLAPDNWIPAICYLQQQGKIANSCAPELIVIWLAASINTIIQDDLKIFHDPQIRTAYLNLIVEGFEHALKSFTTTG
jgi:AcrR family transcriptional regulator